MKLAVSLLATIAFGGLGIGLYLYFVSLHHAEGPTPTIIAYALCWPVILLGRMSNGPGPIDNFDLIVWHKFGWLALSLYYYLIVSLIVALRRGRHLDRAPQTP
jgi:hypothetical protein